MVEQQELKRCPFCGGEAETYPYYFNEWYIGCGKCSCDLGVFDTKEEAVEAWNKRTSCDTCAMYYPNDGCMAGLAEGEVES